MAEEDDRIWLACLHRRDTRHRVAIHAGIYLAEGRHRVPGMAQAEVEEVILDFFDDLRTAGWQGPHPPGRGRRPVSESD